jgi:hypothetical protein
MAKKTARKTTARKPSARKPSARRVMRDLLRDGGVRDVDTIVDGLAPFLRKAEVRRSKGRVHFSLPDHCPSRGKRSYQRPPGGWALG